MSWFKSKPKKAKEPTAEELAKQMQMHVEQDKFQTAKVLEGLQTKEKQYESKIEGLSNKISQQENEIKTLIKGGQKVKAKQVLKKVKMERENLLSFQNKQGFISKQIIEMEGMQDDAGMTDIMKDANKIMKKNVEKNEDFREQLETAKELQQENTMNREMMNDLMADSDDDDLDDDLAEYEQEMQKEDDARLQSGFANVHGDLVDPSLNKPEIQKAVKKDNVNDMFAELMG